MEQTSLKKIKANATENTIMQDNATENADL